MSDVSVLGLGLMGSAIAVAQESGGKAVTVWNRTSEKAGPFRERGVAVASSAVEAVAASPLTICVLTDSAALRASLGDDIDLEGHTIVNLSTGTPRDAIQTCEWVQARGGRYLQGTIASYPKDIGTPTGCIVFSGPADLWEEHSSTLMLLGAASNHTSDNVPDACTLDLAMLIYYMSAEGAFQEALAFAAAYGVSPRRLLEHVLPTHTILEREIRDSVDRVEQEDYSTDEATIDTFFACMKLTQSAWAEVGQRGPMTDGARELYRRAVEAGHGSDLPAALFSVLTPASVSDASPTLTS